MFEIELPGVALAPPHQFTPSAVSEGDELDWWDEFSDDMHDVESQCGPNKNDRLATLIAVCLENRIDTKAMIFHVLEAFDYKRGHIAQILHVWTGSNPDRYWWTRDGSGKYRAIR